MVVAKQEPLEKVEVYIARVLRFGWQAAASQEQILFGITNVLHPLIRQHVLTQECRTVENIRKYSLIAETAAPDITDTAALLLRLEANSSLSRLSRRYRYLSHSFRCKRVLLSTLSLPSVLPSLLTRLGSHRLLSIVRTSVRSSESNTGRMVSQIYIQTIWVVDFAVNLTP